jgi:hypothetical protein
LLIAVTTVTRLLSRRPQTSVPDLGLLPTSLTTRTKSPFLKSHPRERIAAATLIQMLQSKLPKRLFQQRSKLSATLMTHQTVRDQLPRKLPQRRLMLTLKLILQVLKKANVNSLSNLCPSKLTRMLLTTTSRSLER